MAERDPLGQRKVDIGIVQRIAELAVRQGQHPDGDAEDKDTPEAKRDSGGRDAGRGQPAQGRSRGAQRGHGQYSLELGAS